MFGLKRKQFRESAKTFSKYLRSRIWEMVWFILQDWNRITGKETERQNIIAYKEDLSDY